MERYVLQFRCAKNGQPFSVAFQRDSSQDNFKIISIWITELLQETTDLKQKNSQNNSQQIDNQIDSSNFDFTDWYCPHCSHRRNGKISEFLHCGSCRELVCGGRIKSLSDETFFFSCHNGCGGKGKLEVGTISFQGKTDIINKQINPDLKHNSDLQILPSNDKLLPPPN
jgi:hypothetical protein